MRQRSKRQDEVLTTLPQKLFGGESQRYIANGRLGEGSMGIVTEVYDRYLGGLYACKTVKQGAPERHHQRLASEARLLSQLDHPGIPKLYDVGTLPDGRPYYTMQKIKGITFEAFLAKRETRGFLRNGLRILRDVCGILEYAHSRGIIHCDLKPGNILLDRNLKPYLIDWGTSETAVKTKGRRKISGCVISGTPLYIGPEILQKQLPTPKADQYAVGVMMYQLLTSHYPYYHDDVFMLFHKICHEPTPSPRWREEDIPEALEALCMKLLQKTPAERFSSSKEVATQLNDWLRHQTQSQDSRANWFAPPL